MIKYIDPKEIGDAIQNVKSDFQNLHQELLLKKQKLQEDEEEEK